MLQCLSGMADLLLSVSQRGLTRLIQLQIRFEWPYSATKDLLPMMPLWLGVRNLPYDLEEHPGHIKVTYVGKPSAKTASGSIEAACAASTEQHYIRLSREDIYQPPNALFVEVLRCGFWIRLIRHRLSPELSTVSVLNWPSCLLFPG